MSIREQAGRTRRGRVRAGLFDYPALTKPRTIHLVVGGTLMTAGANTLNCVADADLDKLMKRTTGRPLARPAVSSRSATVFGLALIAGSLLWFWWTTNPLPGLLAVVTIAFYVFVYTMLISNRRGFPLNLRFRRAWDCRKVRLPDPRRDRATYVRGTVYGHRAVGLRPRPRDIPPPDLRQRA